LLKDLHGGYLLQEAAGSRAVRLSHLSPDVRPELPRRNRCRLSRLFSDYFGDFFTLSLRAFLNPLQPNEECDALFTNSPSSPILTHFFSLPFSSSHSLAYLLKQTLDFSHIKGTWYLPDPFTELRVCRYL
jgi:hypothetical protein